MKPRSQLLYMVLTAVLVAAFGGAASAKLLPGDPIVAVARGKTSKMTSWSSTVNACIGQTVQLNAIGEGLTGCAVWSHDWDYENDPHNVCDTVSFVWKCTIDGVETTLGYQGWIPWSFSEVGTYTCTVTVSDDGGNNNDGDQTASVTVIVGEITDLTGPNQCVLCQSKPYTFTVEACCCDSVMWTTGNLGNPATQDGGCSFDTQFDYPGSGERVTATCGSSQKQSVEYTVERPCEPVTVNLQCLRYDEQLGELDPCVFGETRAYGPGCLNDYNVCFDCGTEEWKVQLVELTMQVQITYDFKNRWDPDGLATCEAAACAAVWYNYVNSGRQQGDICSTACVPQSCVRIHERQHAQEYCDAFQTYASVAQAQIAALSRSPHQPYCNAIAAYQSLSADVIDILNDMYLNIGQAVISNGETGADAAMLPCLRDIYQYICASLDLQGIPCDACP